MHSKLPRTGNSTCPGQVQDCLPFIQVCKYPTLRHNTLPQNRKLAFWLSAALQKQQTAALCHCSYTYAIMPLVQACKCPTLMHNTLAQDRKHAFWLSAALHKKRTAALCRRSAQDRKHAF